MRKIFYSIILFLCCVGVAYAESGWQGDQASDIKADTTNFSNNLSAADDNVQKALETLDALVGGGGGGAPTNATYITQTANGSLSAEQALSGLTTGLMKVTNGTGVISTAADGTDYLAPTRIDDSKGNGDTGYVWSADKVFDQLALKQAADADLTTYAGITPTANAQTLLGETFAQMQASLSVDDLITLSGVAEGSVNLGTFTGSTIADNLTLKAALQSLETAVEGKQGTLSNSAGLYGALSDETGSASGTPLAVFNVNPTLTGATMAGTLAVGAYDITMSGSLGVTGTRLTKGWFTNLESTNAPTVSGSAVYYAGGTDVAIADGGSAASTAEIAYNNIAALVAAPASDHTANGPHTNAINAGGTITVMDLVILNSSGKWVQTDANSSATYAGMLAISLESKNDTQAMNVALPGSVVRDDTWNWTPGATLYMSETAAQITATAPTTTDAATRIIGYAISADEIWFRPDNSYYTHT